MTSIRAALCAAVVGLIACGSPAVGTIAGKVVFSDGSDASGLSVTLVGGVGQTVKSSGGGNYSFEKLPDGIYLVSVDAADTKEHKLSFASTVKGTEPTAAPDLTFTSTGNITGKVTLGGAMMPAVGATVYLGGSDHVAFTDAAGAYTFQDIPAGDYTLVARATGTIAQSATAMLKVKRGKNDGPALALADDLGVTGKLEGVVYYFNFDKPAGIKVSVADVSANTDDKGFFSLTLPPGTYTLIAEAAGYPKQTIGVFTVNANETTTIPTTPLTLYKTFATYESAFSPVWMGVSEGDTAILRLSGSGDYSTAIYAIDTKAVDRKLLFLGSPSNFHLSKLGKWFAFQPSTQGVAVINTQTGKTYTFAATGITGPLVSSDESVMFFHAGGQNLLYRVDLATGTPTTFPAFSGSIFMSNDRFLAKSQFAAPFDVQLITPTTASTVANPAIAQMQQLIGYTGTQVVMGGFPGGGGGGVTTFPLVFAYNCAAACNVQVLGLAANGASPVGANVPVTPFAIPGSTRDWLGMAWGGITPGRILVKVADGSPTTLPAQTYQLLFNETSTRVVTLATNPGNFNTDLREDVVPPSPTSTVHLSASGGVQSPTWISPSRFVTFTTTASTVPTTRKLEIKSGTASSDGDIVYDVFGLQTPFVVPPAVMWLKQSTMKRIGIAYDSTEFAVDTVGPLSGTPFSGVGARTSSLNGLLGKYAVIWDGASAHTFDGTKNESRKSPGVPPASSEPPFVAVDRFRNVQFGPSSGSQGLALQFFDTGKIQLVSEPRHSDVNLASLPKGGVMAAAYTCGIVGGTCNLDLALLP
jgi:hypothetical protein